jgi:tape measure domain-containing protein
MNPEVELRLTADLDDAAREVAGFRKEYGRLVQEVEKPLRQANTFRQVGQDLEGTQRQISSTKDRLRQLRDEIVKAESPSKELQADYRNATSELKRLERQESSQIGQLRSVRSELQAAGVDVGNLAAEQRRLGAEFNRRFETGRADAALQAAREALGVGEIETAQRRLVELRGQYRLVTQDGSLSARERREAESNYRKSVSDTLGQLRRLRSESASQATEAQREALAIAQRQAQAKAGIAQLAAEQRKAAVASRQAALEAARNDLGINRARAAQESIQQLQKQYELLRTSGSLTTRELGVAQDTLSRKIRETRQELAGSGDAAGQGATGVAGSLTAGLGLAGGAFAATAALRSYVEITDTAKKMNAQLKLATTSQEEFNQAQEITSEIAERNQAPLADVVALYSRLQPALSQLGRGQSDVVAVIDAVTMSLRISGATAEETASTIQQFSQALGSGVLRGEEFNTLAESSPRLLRALADGLKVPIGALRDMAAEGELTADVITDTLLGQLPKLAEEAAQLPDTVGGALTRLRNDVLKSFGDGDTSGLIGAVTELRRILTDPQVVQGLKDLASGMATLAGWTARAASEFSGLAKEIAYSAAVANGHVDELTKLEKTLEGVKAARDGGSLIGRPTATFFMSQQQLDAWAKELEGKIVAVRAKIQGVTVEALQAMDAAAESSSKSAEKTFDFREERLRQHAQKNRQVRAQMVKDADDGNKKLIESLKKRIQQEVSAERAALSEIDKIKKARADLETKYQQVITGFNAGGDDPSFGAANALKVSARNALQDGNVDKARSDAQAALEMLQQLQQAGANTYGFGGFAKELLAIEDAALGIEQSNAEQKLADIRTQIADLRTELDGIKDVKVTVSMSDEEIQGVISKVEQLSAQIGKPIVIPIVYAHPDGAVVKDLPAPPQDYVLTEPTPPSFATGGIARGPGTGTSDSIWARISNGEGILTARAVQHYGSGLVHQLNRLQMPRFATGGVMGERYSPAIPAINPSLLAPAQQAGGGNTVVLKLGGNTYTLQADNDNYSAIVHNESRKHGRK